MLQHHLSLLSLSVISWSLLTTLVGGSACHEWQSCASSDISETGLTTLECYAYQSCMNSSISITGDANVECSGSYSCAGSSIHKFNGNWMHCYGFHSCSHVNPLFVTSGSILGYGASALVDSNVTLTSGGTIYCDGDRTCADSFIVGSGTHYMFGHLSAQNSIFKSYNYDSSVTYYFRGTMSGKNGTILCGNNHTCNVECYGNACNGLNLTCVPSDGNINGTCIFTPICTYAYYDEYVCPDGEQLSPFMNGIYLPDISNVSIASSHSDYQTGLNDCQKTGIGETDFCFGYQSCTGHDQQLKNDSVCCSGSNGCENAMSIAIDTDTDGSSNSSSNSSSSFVRCDGSEACDHVTNGININITQTSTSSPTGIIYISSSGYHGSSWTTVDAGGDGDIVCAGQASCSFGTLINANNLYCNGYYSCQLTTVSDVANLYVYGYRGGWDMTVVDHVENVYCGSYGCYNADINNVDNDLYCYGYRCLYSGSIKNVKNVFVFGYEAIYGTTITNVNQLYCDGTKACSSTTISNVSNIQANGTNVLNGTTISSGGNGVTMTLILYRSITGSVSVTCESGDTCIFDCNNTGTCNTINFLCNGICLFDTYSSTTVPSNVPTIVPSKIPTMASNTIKGTKDEVFCDSHWKNCTIQCNSFSDQTFQRSWCFVLISCLFGLTTNEHSPDGKQQITRTYNINNTTDWVNVATVQRVDLKVVHFIVQQQVIVNHVIYCVNIIIVVMVQYYIVIIAKMLV